MKTKIIILLLIGIFLTSCKYETSTQDIEVVTEAPLGTLTPTKTLLSTATPLPPTATPTPFLPAGLPLIDPENIASLQRIAEIPVKEIYQLTVSPAGNYVATLSTRWDDRSRYMEVWNLNTGTQVYQQEKMDIPSRLFFLPDETMLVVLFPYDEPQVRIYDLTRGEIVRTLDTAFDAGALSPDGKLFAASSHSKTDGAVSSTITLYDFATGKKISALNSVGQVVVLNFSPDGQLLVAGLRINLNSRDKIWKIASLELVSEMVNYSFPIFTLDSSLAASSKNGTVFLFDPKGWVSSGAFGNINAYANIRPQSFSKDGRILIGSDTYRALFWDVEKGEEIFAPPDYGFGFFSPTGKIVFTWCTQCNLTIWGVSP